MTKPELKDRIITYEELYGMLKLNKYNLSDEKEDNQAHAHKRIILRCIGCKHRDLLFKFIKSHEGNWPSANVDYFYGLKSAKVDKYFYCPKCESSMIAIDEQDLPKVLSWIV